MLLLRDLVRRSGRFPPGTPALPPDWRVWPRRQPLKTKPVSVWDHQSSRKYNAFVVGPEVLVAAGQPAEDDAGAAILDAVKIEDGSRLWRQKIPSPVVKGGLALDHEARIVVSMQDGGLICLAAAE